MWFGLHCYSFEFWENMHVEKEAILFFRETTNDLGRESKKTAVCGDERLVMTQTLYRFSPRVGLMKEKEEISRLLYNLSVCWSGVGSAIIFAHSIRFSMYCSRYPQVPFFSKNNFKTGSHDTIYTIKNYFTIVFSVFSFQQ